MKIQTKPRFYPVEYIKQIEEKYNGKFICETCIKDSLGWMNRPLLLFYSEEKHKVSGSHYFCVYQSSNGGWYIMNGQSAVDEDFTGVLHKGVVYFSVFRHDNHVFDGDLSVDGGRDYTITAKDLELVKLSIVKDKLIIKGKVNE